VLERCADPRALKQLGRRRLAALMCTVRATYGIRQPCTVGVGGSSASRMATSSARTGTRSSSGGALELAALAEDLAAEARLARCLDEEVEIAVAEERIGALYGEADPGGIVRSAPGLQVTLAAGILGHVGEPEPLRQPRRRQGLHRAGAQDRAVGHLRPARRAHQGGRPRPARGEALFLVADQARRVDPTLAAKDHRLVVEEGKHHASALCTLAPIPSPGSRPAGATASATSCATSTAARSPRRRAARSAPPAIYAIPREIRRARRRACARFAPDMAATVHRGMTIALRVIWPRPPLGLSRTQWGLRTLVIALLLGLPPTSPAAADMQVLHSLTCIGRAEIPYRSGTKIHGAASVSCNAPPDIFFMEVQLQRYEGGRWRNYGAPVLYNTPTRYQRSIDWFLALTPVRGGHIAQEFIGKGFMEHGTPRLGKAMRFTPAADNWNGRRLIVLCSFSARPATPSGAAHHRPCRQRHVTNARSESSRA
jgi:hypothetical protein